jgi:cell division protein FtsB
LIYNDNLVLALRLALWHKLYITTEKPMADELAAKLNSVLSELKTVMQQRKDRIEELRAEIEDIEASNEDLEKQISTMLENF